MEGNIRVYIIGVFGNPIQYIYPLKSKQEQVPVATILKSACESHRVSYSEILQGVKGGQFVILASGYSVTDAQLEVKTVRDGDEILVTVLPIGG